ncbi:Regulatory protein GAL4 [Pleurostoma richardsiae]|uniref:Regulatory protein GAL4 n=1 Tax=Pleurostoma richardsiae TaxID=41990 RepID=A0AA38R7N5_9PEZI|nr:Regulatory protein GAL4 [Pleurostoma richardsiae]
MEMSFELTLGQAEQACKECRRRKLKCNKAIPICDLCLKHRRHCLYEKHARTPLTRRHLTEVEERLERAEAMLRQMRQYMPPPRRQSANSGGVAATSPRVNLRQQSQENHDAISPASLDIERQGCSLTRNSLNQATTQEPAAATDVFRLNNDLESRNYATLPLNPPPPIPDHSKIMQPPGVPAKGNGPAATAETQGNPLERPPASGDFEWDEQETVGQSSPREDNMNDSGDDGTPGLDGMASLTMGDRESGYLGVASGAALLRILEPVKGSRDRSKFARYSNNDLMMPGITTQPNMNKHITDSMVDAYFYQYHLSYPIIHEPTFRAQYCEVIPRPNGDSWVVLAYVIAALGVFCSATDKMNKLDLELFAQARSILSFNFLEMGNLTLVQALTLISNYQQKRDKPNSSYNYLGLAVRMAMGLGLQKEFQGWNISPLNMEIRRRIWWCLCVFDVGGTITFSRPLVFPLENSEVSLPMNVNDRDLTAASKSYPPASNEITPYTHVRIQASFHIATAPIYTRVISKPLPSIEELTHLDQKHLAPWIENVPSYWKEGAPVASRFTLAHAVMTWRYRNFRIIMYRPIVVRRALLHARQSVTKGSGRNNNGQLGDYSPESEQAYERCLEDAKFTIESISKYWEENERSHDRLAAWYALYFLFQSALIPCICLRNEPLASRAADWRIQITTTLRTTTALAVVNSSAARSYQIITELCGKYLDQEISDIAMSVQDGVVSASAPGGGLEFSINGHDGNYENIGPTEDSPQTQINSVIPMMWPNVAPVEATDLIMGDDAAWIEYLGAGGGDSDGQRWVSEQG